MTNLSGKQRNARLGITWRDLTFTREIPDICHRWLWEAVWNTQIKTYLGVIHRTLSWGNQHC